MGNDSKTNNSMTTDSGNFSQTFFSETFAPPQKIIDVHTHFFTSAYVPIAGLAYSYGVPIHLGKLIENSINFVLKRKGQAASITEITLHDWVFDEPAEYYEIESVSRNREIPELSLQDVQNRLETLLSYGLSQHHISGTIDTNTLKFALPENREEEIFDLEPISFKDVISDIEIVKERMVEDRRDIEDIHLIERAENNLHHQMRLESTWLLIAALAALLTAVLSVFLRNKINWVLFLINTDEYVFSQMIKDLPGADTIVGHLIDMDAAFRKSNSPKSVPYLKDFATRVGRINKICTTFNHDNRTNKHVYTFLPYHPDRHKEFMDFAKNISFRPDADNAIVGIKYYPPLGYKPEDDIKNEIFKFCVDNEVAIMCHNQEASLRKESAFIEYSKPGHWEPVLEQYSELKICFAHAGGAGKDVGWFLDSLEKFRYHTWGAYDVLRMCCKYDNAYCDFSAASEITNKYCYQNLLRILLAILNGDQRLLEQNSKGPRSSSEGLINPEKFFSRLMFGTDWHLIYEKGKPRTDFYQGFIELFNHPDLQKYKENFFHKNAEQFLGFADR